MSFRKFNHEGVDYTLFLGMHGFSSYPMIKKAGGLESLDVLVMESGGYDLKTGLDSMMEHHQYKKIFNTVKRESLDTKIYFVDFNNSYDLISPNSISIILAALLSDPVLLTTILTMVGTPLINSIKRGKAIPIIQYPNDLANLAFPTPITGLRNAVTAEKITKYIVPKEQKDNLRIGILYGGAHSGISWNIQYPATTDYALALYEKLGWWGVKDKGQLNGITKVTLVDGEWITEQTDCGLFKVTGVRNDSQ